MALAVDMAFLTLTIVALAVRPLKVQMKTGDAVEIWELIWHLSPLLAGPTHDMLV